MDNNTDFPEEGTIQKLLVCVINHDGFSVLAGAMPYIETGFGATWGAN